MFSARLLGNFFVVFLGYRGVVNLVRFYLFPNLCLGVAGFGLPVLYLVRLVRTSLRYFQVGILLYFPSPAGPSTRSFK